MTEFHVSRPTHVCTECGAFWKLNPALDPAETKMPAEYPLHKETWSLVSEKAGKCCDNALMGLQIRELAREEAGAFEAGQQTRVWKIGRLEEQAKSENSGAATMAQQTLVEMAGMTPGDVLPGGFGSSAKKLGVLSLVVDYPKADGSKGRRGIKVDLQPAPLTRWVAEGMVSVLRIPLETLESLLGCPLHVEVDGRRRILECYSATPAKESVENLEPDAL